MRFGGITNKDTLKCFWIKFGQVNTFLKIETLTTKYSEVLDIGLVAGKYFIRSLVQALRRYNWFVAWQAVVMASAQKLYRDLKSANMVLAISMRVWFFYSATPFYGECRETSIDDESLHH
jgi:hypothetical protein